MFEQFELKLAPTSHFYIIFYVCFFFAEKIMELALYSD